MATGDRATLYPAVARGTVRIITIVVNLDSAVAVTKNVLIAMRDIILTLLRKS